MLTLALLAIVAQQPTDTRINDLAATGMMLGLALPAYTLVHEGAHAVGGICNGHKVAEFHPFPSTRTGSFTLGYTRLEGPLEGNERLLFLGAPKLVDLAILGTTTTLTLTGLTKEMPRLLRLGLWSLSVAAWIDYSKETLFFTETSDAHKIITQLGFTSEADRNVARTVYAVSSVALLVPVVLEAVSIATQMLEE